MKLEDYRPLWRQILLKKNSKEKTDKGIYLPSESTLTPTYTVIDVGEECQKVKKGDVVLIDPKALGFMVEMIFDEGEHIQVMEQNIIGRFKQ